MTETAARDGRWGSGIEGSGSRLTANRVVLLAAVPLFLVLALTAYLTFQFAASQRDAQALVRHTYEVMEAQRRVQDDIQAAEAGQRGYLLTNDPAFFDNYQRAAARLPADLALFRDLTKDNPSQQARAGRLKQLLEARLRGLETSRRLAAPLTNTPPPLVLEALERGRQQMAALRAEVSNGLLEEQRLLDERNRLRRQTETLTIGFAIGAGFLTLIIMLMAAWLLVRNNLSLAASQKARANEAAILQATLETVREGIAYFTSDGWLCAFNARFFALLDLPQDHASLQMPLSAFQALEAARIPGSHIFEPPTQGDEKGNSTHLIWGGRQLDIYKAPVFTGGFIIGVVDQTERLQAETLMRQAQKMEAIGHLTGGVAHDFNNLLQIISANLDLAVASGAVRTDPRLTGRLQNAMAAVARGSRLIAQLLAFARRQPLEPRAMDLGRVIRDMSDMLRRTLGETIQIETVIAGGLWNTLADPNQIENTVLNLAINARDAMPQGGKLTLEVANAYLDDNYAAIHGEVTPGQYVMLAVSDTGSGMTPDVKARVFEPFFTTKPEGKGTGLGLAQAYGFTKQTGGHIKIYSEVGEGTTVRLYLPRTRRDADLLDESRPAAVERGSEHILVVEDDEGVRAAVVDMLTDLGYRVSRAANAEAALDLLKQETPDLIFTDVVMPGAIATREFIRRAQDMHPTARVLYTSGYTQNAIVHNGKLDEDALLLSKPYRKEELARKLRSVFAGTARGANPASAGKAPQRHKVLVVEDVALIRMTTVDMVEQIGFAAAQAADAEEALAILRREPIDILLTDLGLPGMNGRELVQEALKLKPSLKVIIASGYSTDKDQTASLPVTVAYLTKPFDMQQLRRALMG